MLKQDITIEDKAVNKLTIHGQGKDVVSKIVYSNSSRNAGLEYRYLFKPY